MKIASVADIKARLSEYIKATDQGPVVITRNGKAVAAIISLADEDDLERVMLSFSPKLRGLLADSRARIAKGERLSSQQFWKEMNGRGRGRRKSA